MSQETPIPRDIEKERIAEYQALRQEIVTRIQLRHQMETLGIIALGGLLTLGYQKEMAWNLAPYLFSPLAFVLALAWCHNDGRIWKLGKYIRENLEVKDPPLDGKYAGLRWESSSRPSRWSLRPTVLVAAGIFLLSQVVILAIKTAPAFTAPDQLHILVDFSAGKSEETTLRWLAAGSIILTAAAFMFSITRSPKN